MTHSPSPRPTRSPWGSVQDAKEWLPGIWGVSTPSHGGLLLSEERREAMPAALRRRARAYEEDCEWCLPVIAFANEFVAAGHRELVASAETAFVNHYPDEHERFRGVRPTAEQSAAVRQAEANLAVVGRWVVRSAWGSWADWVPVGKVGVAARVMLDTERHWGAEVRWFLVDADRYRDASRPAAVDELSGLEVAEPVAGAAPTKRVGG